MKVIIEGKVTSDPRSRVLAIEAAAQAICESTDQDPADAVMMLLTAAVHISAKHSAQSPRKIALVLAECLGRAVVAADDFFKLKMAS